MWKPELTAMFVELRQTLDSPRAASLVADGAISNSSPARSGNSNHTTFSVPGVAGDHPHRVRVGVVQIVPGKLRAVAQPGHENHTLASARAFDAGIFRPCH
jgi:hypothetical protein